MSQRELTAKRNLTPVGHIPRVRARYTRVARCCQGETLAECRISTFGRRVSGPDVMVAWVIASVAFWVARVGDCTDSSPLLCTSSVARGTSGYFKPRKSSSFHSHHKVHKGHHVERFHGVAVLVCGAACSLPDARHHGGAQHGALRRLRCPCRSPATRRLRPLRKALSRQTTSPST